MNTPDNDPSSQAPPIPVDVAADLPRLRASYQETTNSPFTHFFCPFMHADEPVQLCMGHVVPKSYPDSSRKRVAQRADIDNFYGAHAEGDFGLLLEARNKPLSDLIFDPRLQKLMGPCFSAEGEVVGHYPDRGGKGRDHTRILLEDASDGRQISLVFKKSPDEMLAALGANWGVAVERDCRLTALVTLVKAACLTMFHLHGYRWALSAGGTFVCHSLLGRFFRENRDKHAAEVREAMKPFFVPYKHMVRPIERFGWGDPPRGTLEDDFSGLCLGSSGRVFAHMVYVRIAGQCHAVLMPGAEDPEAAATYCEFLDNDNEQLRVSHTRFDREEQCWRMDPEPVTAHWPKKDVTFDFE